MTTQRKWGVIGVAVAVVTALGLGLGALIVLFAGNKKDPVVSVPTTAEGTTAAGTTAAGGTAAGTPAPGVTAADLEKVAHTRVFFGHQSVGMNILGGIPAVFAEHGVAAPTIADGRTASPGGDGFVQHATIGENVNPLSKIKDFDAAIRAGVGEQVDVALMKLCYVDIDPKTDVDSVFATYSSTMAALERDFPDVTFVKVTVPLTTEPGGVSRFKDRVSGQGNPGAAANAARQRFNDRVRTEYAGDHLFDLAAVESTTPDGSRVGGTHQGTTYFSLYSGYASDDGHLNEEGSRRAAGAWLAAVAGASAK